MSELQHISFANLVAEMRRAQKNYFRTRASAALEECKRLEFLVDRALKDALTVDDDQQHLFKD